VADKLRLLSEWATFIDRESCLLTPGYSTLWHPRISRADGILFRQHFSRRLVEIEAGTTEEALYKFRLTKWQLGFFYHVACMGNYQDVTDEQLKLAASVGLNWMYVGFLGSDEQRACFERRASALGMDVDCGLGCQPSPKLCALLAHEGGQRTGRRAQSQVAAIDG